VGEHLLVVDAGEHLVRVADVGGGRRLAAHDSCFRLERWGGGAVGRWRWAVAVVSGEGSAVLCARGIGGR
jgi:hypothetical protein